MIKHLDEKYLMLLKNNKLDNITKIDILKHISDCKYCSLKLSNLYIEDYLLETPVEFEQSIIHKINNKKLEKPTKKKNNGLWGYSFRVGIAMCASLLIVFANPINMFNQLKNVPTLNLEYIESITNNIKSFSDKIIIWGLAK